MDGWSEVLFLDAFFKAYLDEELDWDISQYFDICFLEEQMMEQGIMEEQMMFWEERLKFYIEPFEVITDYIKTPNTSDDVYCRHISLNSDTLDTVCDIAALSETSVNTVFMTMYAALLHRFSGKNIVCF